MVEGSRYSFSGAKQSGESKIRPASTSAPYLKFDRRETNSSDILQFWKTIADSLPALSKVAAQILIVPAAFANDERLFSAAGQIISERRSNISPDVVNNILFLRSAKKMK